MRRAWLGVLVVVCMPAEGCGTETVTSTSVSQRSLRGLAPSVSFEPAPADSGARYVARGTGGVVGLDDRGASFRLRMHTRSAVVRLGLPGARAEMRVQASGVRPEVINDYRGTDRSRWRTGVHTYSRAHYRNVWPGTDLLFHGKRSGLEYDFVVGRGADPRDVRMRLGGGHPRLDRAGRLVVATRAGRLIQRRPHVYQRIGGRRLTVHGRFVLRGRTVRFAVGRYDHRYPLVIDPTVLYATFNGGSAADLGAAVAAGPDGSAYVVGATFSTDFPTVNPADTSGGRADAFVTKLSPNASTRVFSTYLSSSGDDDARGVALVDPTSLVVVGETQSSDFPHTGRAQTTHPSNHDAFIVRLHPTTGALQAARLLGDTGEDVATDVAWDLGSNRYSVVGTTTSSSGIATAGVVQPARAGSDDLFIARYAVTADDPAAVTYLGGTAQERSPKIDALGTGVVVATETTSSDFPLHNGSGAEGARSENPNVGVAFLPATLTSTNFSTLLGGSGTERRPDIAVDLHGRIVVVAESDSTDMAVVQSIEPDQVNAEALVARYSGGSVLDLKSKFAASPQYDAPRAVLVGGDDRIVVGGQRCPTPSTGAQSDCDAYIWRLADRAAGGSGGIVDQLAIPGTDAPSGSDVVDSLDRWGSDDIYAAGTETNGGLTTTAGVVQPAFGGGPTDAFALKLAAAESVTTPPDTVIDSGPSGNVRGTTQAFTFHATDPSAHLECSYDAAPYTACDAGSYVIIGATVASHSFSVRARDVENNADPSPATRSFTIFSASADPPDTVITSGPSGTVSGDPQTFKFAAQPAESGVTFECRLDGAAFATCSSPHVLSGLADGRHTFSVRLKDAAGEVDPSPASRTFTVDGATPNTTITSAPTGKVRGTTHRIAFSSSLPNSTFTCKLDAGTAKPCSSPFELTNLSLGEHTVAVTAISRYLVADPTPATATFDIFAVSPTQPDTVITRGPSGTVAPGPQTFEFVAAPDEPGVTFECKLDAAADFSPCTSPLVVPDPAPGSHTLAVRLRDAGGVVDPTPVIGVFNVSAPAAPTTTPPPAAVLHDLAGAIVGERVVLDASESTSAQSYLFDLDGDGNYERDTQGLPTVTTSFARPGTYRVGVRVLGSAGRSADARATVTVTDVAAQITPSAGGGVAIVGKPVTFNQGFDAAGASRAVRAAAENRIYTYDFGDASTNGSSSAVGGWTFRNVLATQQSVAKHTFRAPGTYTFEMKSIGLTGASVTTIGQIDVVVNDSNHQGGSAKHPVLVYAGEPALGLPFTVHLEAGEQKVMLPANVDANGNVVGTTPGVLAQGTAKFSWGDGSADSPEDDSVAGHFATHEYHAPGQHAITGTYTPDDGSKPSKVIAQVEVRQPVCGPVAFLGKIKVAPADGSCFVAYGDDGYVTAPGASMLLGGVRINAANGHRMYFDAGSHTIGPVPGDAGGPSFSMSIDGQKFAVNQYRLQFDLAPGASSAPPTASGNPGGGVLLNGFAVGHWALTLAGDHAFADLQLVIPSPFLGYAPYRLGSAVGNRAKAASSGFELHVPDIDLGPIKARFDLKKDSQGVRGGGALKVFSTEINFDHDPPPPDGHGPSGFAFGSSGSFLYGGLVAKELPPILGVVKVHKIAAKIITDPFFFQGQLNFGVPAGVPFVTGDVCLQMQHLTKGETTVRCGPDGTTTLSDCLQQAAPLICAPLIRVARADGFYLYARGRFEILEVPVDGYVDYRDTTKDQLVDFGVSFKYAFASFFSVNGAIDGTFQFKPSFHWQVFGHAGVSVLGYELASAELLVNDLRLAGCIRAFNILAGAIYTWKTKRIETFSNLNPFVHHVCNLKQRAGENFRTVAGLRDLRPGPPMARMTVNDLRLGATPKTQIVVHGAGGPPRVDLIGPGGTRITDTDDDRMQVDGNGYTIVHFPEGNITQIGIAKPKAGRWQVQARPGSPAITAVDTAEPAPLPIVRANVVKRHGRYVLRYINTRGKGRRVTFIEQIGTSEHEIGIASRKRGNIGFQPGLGRKGRRRIFAAIAQDGTLIAKSPVATYTAPVTDVVPKPSVVHAVRKPGRAIVSWTPVSGAVRYDVKVTTSQGQVLSAQTTKQTVTFHHFVNTTPARVEVRAIDAEKLTSAPARARSAAERKLPKPVIKTKVVSTRHKLAP